MPFLGPDAVRIHLLPPRQAPEPRADSPTLLEPHHKKTRKEPHKRCRIYSRTETLNLIEIKFVGFSRHQVPTKIGFYPSFREESEEIKKGERRRGRSKRLRLPCLFFLPAAPCSSFSYSSSSSFQGISRDPPLPLLRWLVFKGRRSSGETERTGTR